MPCVKACIANKLLCIYQLLLTIKYIKTMLTIRFNRTATASGEPPAGQLWVHDHEHGRFGWAICTLSPDGQELRHELQQGDISADELLRELDRHRDELIAALQVPLSDDPYLRQISGLGDDGGYAESSWLQPDYPPDLISEGRNFIRGR